MKRLIIFLATTFIIFGTNKQLFAQSYYPEIVEVNENDLNATADAIFTLLQRPGFLAHYHPNVRQDIFDFLQKAVEKRTLCQNQCPLAAPLIIEEAPRRFELLFEFQGLTAPNPAALKIQTGFLQLEIPNGYSNEVSPITESRMIFNTEMSKNTLVVFSVYNTNDRRGRIQVIIIGEKNIMKTGTN